MPKETINNGLTIQVLLDKAHAFLSGEIDLEELNNWGNGIEVRAYIPSIEKSKILMEVINDYTYADMELKELIVVELYKYLFFRLYLEGYLFVQKISEEEMTYENYDILNSIYGPWIESYAERDILLFKDMMKDTLNFYSLDKFGKALEMVDYEKINESVQANKDLVETLEKDKDIIKDLKDLTLFNNPIVKDIVDETRKSDILEEKE